MAQVNYSLNGIPGTLWEIRRQENIHPYLGLRQAILIIDEKEKALRDGILSQKKSLLGIKNQKVALSNLEGDELEIKQDEVEIAECDAKMFNQLILDAEMELKVAQAEKQRIEACNPDMVTKTYDELQEKYANVAFRCKLTRVLVVSAYSRQMQLSEGAAEIMYDSACLSTVEQQELNTNSSEQFFQLLGLDTNSQNTAQSTVLPNLLNGNINGIAVN